MNLQHASPPIWISRHGESISNLQGRIGGDSDLAPRGHRYARSLVGHMRRTVPGYDSLAVWTSSLQRTIQTGSCLERPTRQWRALDEIDAGLCDGMTYPEIQSTMPDESEARKKDKLHYRYPRGESYTDVIQRLVPVVIEMERRREPLLIIAHQAVARMLYAYLMGIEPAEATRLDMPLHTVIQLTPHAYGCHESRSRLMPHVPFDRPSS
jgi:broad specificity phosphatase PhoE